MGKVFVKGPVESPDDLLAKESQLGRAGRVLGDATEGAIGMTEPIDSFGSLMRKPLGALRYLAEGRYKRKLSPLEEAIQNARFSQMGRDQIREEMQPAMDAKAALAAKEKEEADNQALLSRFQNLSQRTGADIIGLDKYKDKQDLSEFQEFANMNYPGMPLNDVANMLGQQFTNVEGRNIRNVLAGKPAIEGYASKDKANQIIAASNAAEPTMVGVSQPPVDSMPPEIREQRNRNIANQKIAGMAQGPNVAAIAAHPETNALPEGGENTENVNDAAMEAKVNEQGLNDNDEETQEAVQQQGGEKEKPDLNEATEGATQFNFNAGPPQLPEDVQRVFSGNDALAQMRREQGRD